MKLFIACTAVWKKINHTILLQQQNLKVKWNSLKKSTGTCKINVKYRAYNQQGYDVQKTSQLFWKVGHLWKHKKQMDAITTANPSSTDIIRLSCTYFPLPQSNWLFYWFYDEETRRSELNEEDRVAKSCMSTTYSLVDP